MTTNEHIQPCVAQVEPDWLETQEDGSDCSGDEQLDTDNAIDLPQKSYTTNRHYSTEQMTAGKTDHH